MKSGRVLVKKEEAFLTGDGFSGLAVFDVIMEASSLDKNQQYFAVIIITINA